MKKLKKPLSILLLLILLFSYLVVPASAIIIEPAVISGLATLASMLSVAGAMDSNSTQSMIYDMSTMIKSNLIMSSIAFNALKDSISANLRSTIVNGKETYLIDLVPAVKEKILNFVDSINGARIVEEATITNNNQLVFAGARGQLDFTGIQYFIISNCTAFELLFGSFNPPYDYIQIRNQQLQSSYIEEFVIYGYNPGYIVSPQWVPITVPFTIRIYPDKLMIYRNGSTYTLSANPYTVYDFDTSPFTVQAVAGETVAPTVTPSYLTNVFAQGGNTMIIPKDFLDDDYPLPLIIPQAGDIGANLGTDVSGDDVVVDGGTGTLPVANWWNYITSKLGQLVDGVIAIPAAVTAAIAGTAEVSTPAEKAEEVNKMKLPSLIMNKFPFCIPFDILRAVQVLSVPAQTPVFTIPFEIDSLNFSQDIVLDMHEFNGIASVTRWFLSLIFILMLIVSTRRLIKG